MRIWSVVSWVFCFLVVCLYYVVRPAAYRGWKLHRCNYKVCMSIKFESAEVFFLSWTLCHLLSLGWLAIFHNSCEENVILSIEKSKIISWRKTVTEKGQCTYQIFNSVVLKILRQWTCVDLFDNKFLSLVLLAQFSQTLSKVVVGWARDVQILQCEVQPIEWYFKITRPKGDYKFKVLRSIDDS